jgi:hypothetical protein
LCPAHSQAQRPIERGYQPQLMPSVCSDVRPARLVERDVAPMLQSPMRFVLQGEEEGGAGRRREGAREGEKEGGGEGGEEGERERGKERRREGGGKKERGKERRRGGEG